MSLRDLVMGGAGCSAPGVGPSTANPMAGLADSLIGGAAKQQVSLGFVDMIRVLGTGKSSPKLGRNCVPHGGLRLLSVTGLPLFCCIEVLLLLVCSLKERSCGKWALRRASVADVLKPFVLQYN
jgi:hypothetical protein